MINGKRSALNWVLSNEWDSELLPPSVYNPGFCALVPVIPNFVMKLSLRFTDGVPGPHRRNQRR